MKSLTELSQYMCFDTPTKQVILSKLTQDSRQVEVASAFIALKGASIDGHLYIQNALAQGAEVVLCEDSAYHQPPLIYAVEKLRQKLVALAQWFYDYNPKFTVAVTGTNGKTSVTHYLAQAYTYSASSCLLLGTTGNGIYPQLESSTHTTLDPLSLYAQITLGNEVEYIAMEISSHALDQGRVDGLHIDVAVFTNLSQDHLDYHKTMDDYFKAKAKLFIHPTLSCAVINLDDVYAQSLLNITTAPKVVTYSKHQKKADIAIVPIRKTSDGFELNIYCQGNHIGFTKLPLLGDFNLENVAAMFAVLYAQGFDIHLVIENIIPYLKAVVGRMEVLSVPLQPTVIIDYAHTPDAVEKALSSLKQHLSGKLWCIFGCGGNRDSGKRPLMAQMVERYADYAIVTEDNSRLESLLEIIHDIKQGFTFADYQVIEDRSQAIYHALSSADVNDMIVILGKGHERYMDTSGKRIAFDEPQLVQSYWDEKKMSIASLKLLAQQANLQYFGDDVEIAHVSINSREIYSQTLFVAVIAQRDGHDFIQDAITNGAVAVLLSLLPAKPLTIPYIICDDTTLGLKALALAKRKTLTMPVIGLTGSCGKTTVKEMLALIMSIGGKVHATKGNLNNMLGVPMTILETPTDVDYAIYEAGTNAPNEIAYLAEMIQPDVAIITNIDAAHLEKLKSLDGVLIEKSALFQALNPDGMAIINADDDRLAKYASQLQCQRLYCSKQHGADISVHQYMAYDQGFNVCVVVDGVTYEYYLPLMGAYNILNSLLVIACAKYFNLPMTQFLAQFAHFKNHQGRFNIISLTDKIQLIDDTYNASAPSVRGALETLSRFNGYRIAVVSNMGELGEEAVYYHQQLGQWCRQAEIDHLYLFGDQVLLAHTQQVYGVDCYYHDKQELVNNLIQSIGIQRPVMILVKGSRANKMEEVVALLRQYYSRWIDKN